MRILFDHQVFSYQQVGGVSRYFSELIRRIPDLDMTVLTGFKRTINHYLLDRGYKPFLGKRNFKGKSHLLAIWNKIQSIRALKAARFDVFHPTYYDPYFLKYLRDKPFVLTIHDMIHELYPDSVSDAVAVQKNKRLLAHKASMVIAVSENTRRDVIQILGIAPEKVVTIYHGNSLAPSNLQAEDSKVPERFLLYVGGRAGYKNASLVWGVLARISTRFPDLRLVHAGGGGFDLEEQAEIASLGIAGKVLHFSVDDQALAGLYRQAECLLYPSHYEGFGIPLVEALSWNCPVIAANTSCLPEIGGKAVTYVEPDDAEAWTTAIAQQLTLPASEERKNDAARLSRAQKFSWDTTVRVTVMTYKSSLGGES